MTDLQNREPAPATAHAAGRPFGARGDGELVDAIAAGDQDALAEAYSQHASRVHALARGVCGHTRAEDLTQEIFLQLWNNPQRYNPERGSLRTYLLMNAHSRAIDVLRSDTARAARETADDLQQRPAPLETDAAALATVERGEVEVLLAALPDVERHAIVLAYFGGHTYREVARLLGVPEGTVKSRIRSGLKHLRVERAKTIDLR